MSVFDRELNKDNLSDPELWDSLLIQVLSLLVALKDRLLPALIMRWKKNRQSNGLHFKTKKIYKYFSKLIYYVSTC